MKIDLAPRGTGKTTRMLEWLGGKETRVLIVHDEREAHRLRSHENNKDIAGRIFTWQEYKNRNGLPGTLITEVSIDNADIILQSQLRHPIRRISILDEEAL